MDDDEIRFARVKMPQLHCFTLDLGSTDTSQPTKVETKSEREHRNKEKERWLLRKKMKKMQQLAASNAASAKRILEKPAFEDLTALDSFNINELIAVDHFIYGSKPSEEGFVLASHESELDNDVSCELVLATVAQQSEEQGDEKASESEEATGNETYKNSNSKRTKSVRLSTPINNDNQSAGVVDRAEDDSRISVKSTPAPLSMDDVLLDAKILQAKETHFTWKNCAGIHKSPTVN